MDARDSFGIATVCWTIGTVADALFDTHTDDHPGDVGRETDARTGKGMAVAHHTGMRHVVESNPTIQDFAHLRI